MTDLATRYHFDDFTRDNYRALLRLAQQRYTFVEFTEDELPNGSVLWRHDVDYSVHAARALARIEAEEGVQATYFFRLHSELYNLLEQPVADVAREIVQLGHAVGLHLDTDFHGVSTEDVLDDIVTWEASILERTLRAPVTAFSFHQPTPFLLSCERATYGRRVNTYATRFQQRVGYVSDSNGYWRHRRLEDVLRAGTDSTLQVLTHPEWWTDAPMSPAARIERLISGRADSMRTYYREDMERGGRINVGA